jgi:transcription termination factor NusB
MLLQQLKEQEEQFLQERTNLNRELVDQTSNQQQNFDSFITNLQATHLEQITEVHINCLNCNWFKMKICTFINTVCVDKGSLCFWFGPATII